MPNKCIAVEYCEVLHLLFALSVAMRLSLSLSRSVAAASCVKICQRHLTLAIIHCARAEKVAINFQKYFCIYL